MTRENIDHLINDCYDLGITLTHRQIEQFCKYYKLLQDWNKVMNLTAIIEPEEVIKKHFIDSLSIVKAEPFTKEAKLIDIGTGAGFPGIPIKIVFPNMHVTLLDSLRKRVTFLNEVIVKLHLEHIHAYHGRAEDYARMPDFREQYDFCVSRAVASLPTLLEYGLPFVKPNGYFIAYKSDRALEEIFNFEKIIPFLGGDTPELVVFELPHSTLKRVLFLVHKIRKIPKIFPRKPGIPLKNPMNDTFLKEHYDV
jgi:16S rRNA (guanine527-N7)-methyltransferase